MHFPFFDIEFCGKNGLIPLPVKENNMVLCWKLGTLILVLKCEGLSFIHKGSGCY